MNKTDATVLAAVVGVIATVLGVDALVVDRKVIVGMGLRDKKGAYSHVERVCAEADVAKLQVPPGMTLMGEAVVTQCSADKSGFCTDGGERSVDSPCVMPLDKTCLRQRPGAAKAEWFGFNVMPKAESSGNCTPSPCVILFGDKTP